MIKYFSDIYIAMYKDPCVTILNYNYYILKG